MRMRMEWNGEKGREMREKVSACFGGEGEGERKKSEIEKKVSYRSALSLNVYPMPVRSDMMGPI